MRKLLGSAVLALGVGGLGLYANGHHAKDMQARITADALGIAQGTTHGVTTKVSGRDIAVSGFVSSEDERSEILAALNDVDGRRVVLDDLRALPAMSPFLFHTVKSAQGLTYDGAVPSEKIRSEFSTRIGADAAAGLELAAGAPDDNWAGVAFQGLEAIGGLETAEVTLLDRALTVTGVAATPVEKAAAEAVFDTLPDGYSKEVNITSLLMTAVPFEVSSVKTADGQSYAGSVPNEKARETLALSMGDGAAGLKHAWGAPDDSWTGVAVKGLAVLDSLETGKMALVDRKLTVTGAALTPDEKAAAMAAIGQLPDGYSADVDISTIDDGKPAAYSILYHPVTGTSVTGKLTSDMDTTAIATALGVQNVTGDPVIARTAKYGNGDALKQQLAVMAGWLPELEGFTLTADGAKTRIQANLSPGADVELVEAAMAKELGTIADLELTDLGTAPDEGTVRENAVRGSEIFQGGFWIPVHEDFSVTAQNCARQSDKALIETRVNFVTGSARLDAKSVRAINNIAGVVLQCMSGGNLMAEIGGHTDSDGSRQLNMDLSAERAQSVVDALVARGVPANRMAAKGYGPDEPIATNQTDEGKAANRRTTIRWSEVSE